MSIIDIAMGAKSCGNCTSGDQDWSEEPGDISSWYDCSHPKEPFPDIVDPEKRAAVCPFYAPIMAERCCFCHKELNIPFRDVKYIAVSSGQEPCCSEKCWRKREGQTYWEFSYMLGGFGFGKLVDWIRMKICWPEPPKIMDCESLLPLTINEIEEDDLGNNSIR